jgi:cell division protein ZapE
MRSAADFTPYDPSQAEAARLLRALQQELEARETRRATGLLGSLSARFSSPRRPVTGLYLWGGVGRGKTYLLDWFVEEMPLPGKERAHFHHFMRDVHDELSRLPRQPDPLDVLAARRCRDLRVLCLDEFIVTDITDAMLLFGLLRAYFARGVTLVTTSNTRPDELYRNGLQRQLFLPAIDLLKTHTRSFELDGGTDYRLRTLRQAGVYFHGAEQDAEMQLACYFDRLTGGHQVHANSIDVNGRRVPVKRLGTDVVWFDFDTLCAGNRATSDYIEIAREFHTLMLSDVPVLAPARDAAARRFLHLIDELYDRKVKLVLSASAPLEDLYAGGLHDFPFPRLLSRLTQMQSAQYLAAAGGAKQ